MGFFLTIVTIALWMVFFAFCKSATQNLESDGFPTRYRQDPRLFHWDHADYIGALNKQG